MSGRNRWRKRILFVSAAIVGIPALFFIMATAYFVFVPSSEDYAHRREFDPGAWRDQSVEADSLWPTRLRMVDDLIAGKRLDGLTRPEIGSMLGPEDRTGKFQDWNLVYYLGPERRGLFRIDSEWLVIRFSPSGLVAEYRIVVD